MYYINAQYFDVVLQWSTLVPAGFTMHNNENDSVKNMHTQTIRDSKSWTHVVTYYTPESCLPIIFVLIHFHRLNVCSSICTIALDYCTAMAGYHGYGYHDNVQLIMLVNVSLSTSLTSTWYSTRISCPSHMGHQAATITSGAMQQSTLYILFCCTPRNRSERFSTDYVGDPYSTAHCCIVLIYQP